MASATMVVTLTAILAVCPFCDAYAVRVKVDSLATGVTATEAREAIRDHIYTEHRLTAVQSTP